MNKSCDIANVVLSGSIIDYVHKTKYLDVLLCSDMKTSIDVFRQTSKFYAHANTLLRTRAYLRGGSGDSNPPPPKKNFQIFF